MTCSDVAIVGAGPAGAWAAYTLARRGARVALFDPSHPREKACGGGVTGRALALLRDVVDRAKLPMSVIRTARFVDSHAGESVVVPLETTGTDGMPSLIVASRTAFDRALLDRATGAGATLHRVRVVDVSVNPHGVRLQTTAGAHQAAFVIGADGANSLVRRRITRPFHRGQLSIATGFFAHGITSDEIVIELMADPPGYIWSFPRPDHLAIGICAQADAGVSAEALRTRAAAWISATHLADNARLESYSWPIPSLNAGAFSGLDLAGPRWALAGDAAGLVDPITREGIYFAMLSGQWAAELIESARFPHDYVSRVQDEIGSELARAARLKAGFFRPAFAGLMMRGLTTSPAIRGVMADLISGRQSYATLKWRLLKTFEFGLACRAFASHSKCLIPNS
jgi:geranylgeranyl reductase family protein